MTYRRRMAAKITAVGVATAALCSLATPALASSPHQVEEGETLSEIARDHGVTTADLAAANGIANFHLIRVGQVLAIPGPPVHTVAAGETLGGIARNYGVSVSDIVAANGLDNANLIRVGQELQLPSGASGGQTAGASLDAIRASYPNLPARIVANPNDRMSLVPSFERWAAHYGVPADLLMAIAYQESGWQTGVISHKNAIGVGQLLPGTAEWVANDLIGIPGLDPYNPDDNIRMSARFLKWLTGYLGSEQLAIAGYYQGASAVLTRGIYNETHAYVAAVQGGRWRFQAG